MGHDLQSPLISVMYESLEKCTICLNNLSNMYVHYLYRFSDQFSAFYSPNNNPFLPIRHKHFCSDTQIIFILYLFILFLTEVIKLHAFLILLEPSLQYCKNSLFVSSIGPKGLLNLKK